MNGAFGYAVCLALPWGCITQPPPQPALQNFSLIFTNTLTKVAESAYTPRVEKWGGREGGRDGSRRRRSEWGGGVQEKENQRDLRAGEGGETERMACSQQRGRGGKVSWRDKQGEESASLGLCRGGIRAAACPLIRLPLYIPLCLSVCLPLSSLTVSRPGWCCNVAVSAVKALAGGFSLSEPWLCAVSVRTRLLSCSHWLSCAKQPAGLRVSSCCR